MSRKKLVGQVVSDKMNKTVVIEVVLVKKHPKYKKQYTIAKRYKAHDEKSEYHVGDTVEIEETKPMSREKRWTVVLKIK